MSKPANGLRPFGWRDKVGYMIGNVANDFTFIFASLYLQVLYTDVLGMLGMRNVSFSKEELLKMNAQLNRIRKKRKD